VSQNLRRVDATPEPTPQANSVRRWQGPFVRLVGLWKIAQPGRYKPILIWLITNLPPTQPSEHPRSVAQTLEELQLKTTNNYGRVLLPPTLQTEPGLF